MTQRPRADIVGRMRILAIIQAGGAGSRMDVLTRERAKPALPVAGVYQLLDFPLSNLSHSGVTDVWLSVQYHGATLEEQVANGRPWDLDRTRGGFLALAPRQDKDTGKGGFSSGTADVLWRHTELIRDFAPEALVVVSADAVYALDYEEVVRGPLHDLVAWAEAGEVRGEVTLVVAGAEPTVADPADLLADVLRRVEGGMRLKDACKAVADARGGSSRELYAAAVAAR